MKLGKKLTFVTASVMTAATLVAAVSAAVPSQLVEHGSEPINYEFTDEGFRQYGLSQNYHSYVVDFSQTGIEVNSDKYYLVTFEGRVLSDNGGSKEMIIQLRDDDADRWIGASDLSGNKYSDTNGIPINADGTFTAVGIFTPADLNEAEKGVDGYDKLCAWGKYSNHPEDYVVSYIKVEECDASGTPAGDPVFYLDFKPASAAVEETPVEAATEEPAADDAATPAVTTAAAATTGQKGSPDTGAVGIASITALAILAGGAVIVAKKRK